MILLTLLAVVPIAASAQISFVIPDDSITDYSQYNRIETCLALFERTRKQLSRKSDSVYARTKIFVKALPDTTHERVRWSVHQCMEKFGPESIATHDSVMRGQSVKNVALRLYYIGKHKAQFLELVGTTLQEKGPADTGFRAALKRFEPVQAAINSVLPVNYTFLDSLVDVHIVPVLTGDPKNVPALSEYYDILYKRVTRIYDEDLERGLEGYRRLVARYRNEIVPIIAHDSSSHANQIRRLMLLAYDRINYVAALDSLRTRGPDGYFNALQVNHQLAGLSGNRMFIEGVTQKMITPQAFVVYQYGKDPWQSTTTADGQIVNEPYLLSRDGKPYIYMWMNSLCRREHRNLISDALRNTTGERECWSNYEWIKWLNREYPDLPVTILTQTIGHYSELAMIDPHREAEFIRDKWWNYHGLKANILVQYVDYFNMQELDERREDIFEGNRYDWLELYGRRSSFGGRPESSFYTSLVAPDGRIVANFPGFNVKKSKEVLEAFQTWYDSSQKQAASAHQTNR